MKLDFKEKLETYNLIKIHCKNQKQLLELLEIIKLENLNLHYWMPGTFYVVSIDEYFTNLKKLIVGDEFNEAYVGINSKSKVTLKSINNKSVELNLTTTPEEITYGIWGDVKVLDLDFSLIIREFLLNDLEID